MQRHTSGTGGLPGHAVRECHHSSTASPTSRTAVGGDPYGAALVGQEQRGQRSGGRTQTAVALGSGVAVVLIGSLILAPARDLEGDASIVGLLGATWLVGALRAAALVVLVYVIASVVARTMRAQWANRLGPVDAETSMTAVSEDGKNLQEELDRARNLITDLEDRLSDNLQVITTLSEDGRRSAERIAQLQAAAPRVRTSIDLPREDEASQG